MALLSIRDLSVGFPTGDTVTPVLRNVSFDIAPGSCLGLVGESGSGKSVTSLAMMGLLPPSGDCEVRGQIFLDGHGDLLTLDREEMRRLRGSAISMVFQEPMTSLNPAMRIGEQILEAVRAHESVSRAAAKARVIDLLRKVHIAAPAERFHEYPHRLSGGMRQRVVIAMALAGRPRLLIADEPTTALDVTVQAQILSLLRELQSGEGMSILLISHNLGVIAQLADQVAVMYAGGIVEHGPADLVLGQPEHPYTIGLLGAIPSAREPHARLTAIAGRVPDPSAARVGCVFRQRCPFSAARCAIDAPRLRQMVAGQACACLLAPLEVLG